MHTCSSIVLQTRVGTQLHDYMIISCYDIQRQLDDRLVLDCLLCFVGGLPDRCARMPSYKPPLCILRHVLRKNRIEQSGQWPILFRRTGTRFFPGLFGCITLFFVFTCLSHVAKPGDHRKKKCLSGRPKPTNPRLRSRVVQLLILHSAHFGQRHRQVGTSFSSKRIRLNVGTLAVVGSKTQI